jgi:hypothetical protein
MTIANAQKLLSAAFAASKSGNLIQAARLGLAAQREATKSRSKFAADVVMNGHTLAVIRGGRVAASTVYSHDVKSEAGRIVAESKYLFAK